MGNSGIRQSPEEQGAKVLRKELIVANEDYKQQGFVGGDWFG
jgi:hypothetical protein